MRVAHFRHSCLLVELNDTKILFDPGNFSHGFEGLTDLDAIVITHQHPDHADTQRLPALVEANPGATLLADPQTSAQLGEQWTAVYAGNIMQVGGIQLTGAGGRHAVIHPDIPVIDNTVYLVGTPDQPAQLMHPGDSLFVPSVPVDILALPAAAPWMKISETVDYLRAVQPRFAFPIHQEVISDAGRGIYYSRLAEMAAEGTEFRVLPEEESLQLR
ncbi:MBL fold metallo-hydrolase [Skermania sp. ID1734]|uniref:MBL fold metallo-hydrolase n=1 Tax=Skermania sp. ID1734 TaxID=2597516 RepID=UPI00117ECF94|nr:MBL fold metallo-hydrolase [Skermania sp. ID1734]TSD96663.1 MBL fold metallo-hydrolase [Skermania sp. ID1734]